MLSGGLDLVPDGEGRWRLVEPGRAGSDGEIGIVTRIAEGSYAVESPSRSARSMPAGPYGSEDAVLEAVQAWRLRGFEGEHLD